MVDEQLRKMREYAQKYNVPIMNDEGIRYLTNYCVKNNVVDILEIGTAIAYSTIILALLNDRVRVSSIERDETRYQEAVKNVEALNLSSRINLIYGDALDMQIEGTYDLIFIDAAKAQNIKFFEKYKSNLKSGGAIITDNMNFHGLVFKNESEIESRNLRQLVRKIKNYKTFLEENSEFTTTFEDIGDGIAISCKN